MSLSSNACRGLAAFTLFAAATPAAPQAVAPGQAPAPAPAAVRAPTISPAQADAAVAEVERLIREHYVLRDQREALARQIARGRTSGRYRHTDPNEVARLVTEDLERITNDGHMGLAWAPEDYAQMRSPGAPGPMEYQFLERARLTNHGLSSMRILEGNVRYLRIETFAWIPDVTGRVYDDAMRFLAGGDAIVIDLRGNGGGSTSAVRYAISHFFPATDVERLLMNFTDEEGRPDQSRVLGHLPAGRLNGKPLYVLTDGRSASASEEFAYHVRQFRLGTLVGARTPGAANNNGLYPVAPGFVASISEFRPTHPVGGGNWERTGIAPDIEAPPPAALTAAHLAALETLARTAEPAARRRYEWPQPAMRAELRPVQVAPAELAGLAGRYGERTVRVEGGRILAQRDGMPVVTLVPLGDNLFGYEGMPYVRMRFHLEGGRARAIELLYEDGTSVRAERTD